MKYLAALAAGAVACGNARAPVDRPAPLAVVTASAAASSGVSDAEGDAGEQAGALVRVFAVDGWDAIVMGGRLVVLDVGAKALTAYELDGRRAWHTAVTEHPTGRQELSVHERELWLWGGGELHRIDPATGAILGSGSVPQKDDCSFYREGSACAYGCSCSTVLADCATGMPSGVRFEKTYVEMFGHDGVPPSGGCYGRGTGLIAGTDQVAVVSAEDQAQPAIGVFSHPLVLLGLERASGRELWRMPRTAGSSEWGSGASRDGRVCFSAEDTAVRAFACQSGQTLWRADGPAADPGIGHRMLRLLPTGALFRFDGARAEARALDTGVRLWERAVPAGTFAAFVGTELAFYDVIAEREGAGERALWLLDAKDGAIVATVPMQPGTTTYTDPEGGFYVYGPERDLVAYDVNGHERVRLATPAPHNLAVEGDVVVLYDGTRSVFLEREHLERVAEMTGSVGAVKGSSLAHGFAVYRFQKGAPGHAEVWRKK